MALRPADFREAGNARVGQVPGVVRSFFTLCLVGVSQPLGQQEAIGGDAQAGVMMKAPPASALVVAQAEILLEVLVVTLDAPTHLGFKHHALQRHVLGQRAEPVFERLGIALGPLDEQPLALVDRVKGRGSRYQRLGKRREVWNTRNISTTSPRTRYGTM